LWSAVGVKLNVKFFCWYISAAAEPMIIEASTKAISALFMAGCMIFRLYEALAFLVFNSIRKRMY
jgi:hypothetical protein